MSERLRLTFSATGPMRFVAHLDTMRTWERAIRRANLPLVYTGGFSPHARMALAAPLPVGIVGLNEWMDIWLEPAMAPLDAARALRSTLPPGLTLLSAEAVPESLPSLQSSLSAARYEVRLPDTVPPADLRDRVDRLLALNSLDWEESRGEKTRRYDLRATILDLSLRVDSAGTMLDMHLSLAVGRTGRPAQVLRAMGLGEAHVESLEIVRTSVELDPEATEVPPATAPRIAHTPADPR